MKNILITTPANIDIEYKLAGVGARAPAFIVDALLQLFLVILLGGIIFSTDRILTILDIYTRGSIAYAIFIVGIFVIQFGYPVICEMLFAGRTIGKRIFGLRAIQDNGQPLSLYHILIRGLFRTTLDLLYVGLLAMFFSKKHKRLGDMVAGTIVVIESGVHEGVVSLADAPLPLFISPFIALTPGEKQVVETWQRRKDTLPDKGRGIETILAQHFKERE